MHKNMLSVRYFPVKRKLGTKLSSVCYFPGRESYAQIYRMFISSLKDKAMHKNILSVRCFFGKKKLCAYLSSVQYFPVRESYAQIY